MKRIKICDFTKPELDKFREVCNFTDDEQEYFELRSKNKSNIAISMTMCVSERTVNRLSNKVTQKIIKSL